MAGLATLFAPDTVRAVGAHVLQVTVVAIVVLAGTLLFRIRSARVRYALWTAVVLKFLIPSYFLAWPFSVVASRSEWLWPIAVEQLSLPVERFVSSMPAASAALVGVPLARKEHAVGTPLGVVWTLVLAAWAAGTLLGLGRLLVTQQRTRDLLAGPSVSPDSREGRALASARRTLGVARTVRLTLSDHIQSPAVLGIVRARIVLPRRMAAQLDNAELVTVMIHEVMHAQRFDNFVGALAAATRLAFWFHPLAWLAEARVKRECELACDESVLARTQSSALYARSLRRTCEVCLPEAFPRSLIRSAALGGAVAERLRRILEEGIYEPLSRRQRLGVAALMAGTIGAFVPLEIVAAWPFSPPQTANQGIVRITIASAPHAPVEILRATARVAQADPVPQGVASTPAGGEAVVPTIEVRNRTHGTISALEFILEGPEPESSYYYGVTALGMRPGEKVALTLPAVGRRGRVDNLTVRLIEAHGVGLDWVSTSHRARTRATASRRDSTQPHPPQTSLTRHAILFIDDGHLWKSAAQISADALLRSVPAGLAVGAISGETAVVVRIDVDTTGTVVRADAVSGAAYRLQGPNENGLITRAVRAARLWRFAPARARGRAMQVTGDLVFQAVQ